MLLGNLIEKILLTIGIKKKESCKCKKRQETLNRLHLKAIDKLKKQFKWI